MPVWYDVLQILGEGGQAQVRLLRKRGTSELYAGKFLREHWDPYARQLFKDEGLRQARLAGRVVVPVYDFNFEAPQPFIVLEYMPRGSLAQELASRGTLPVVDALRTTQEIASLLSHLHAKQVIHRDIKPGNIMRDTDGRLRLNDLGLGATMTIGEFVTAGAFLGTPAYAAPEQRANFATPTTDIYALGVILLEMLTGSRVLVGSRPPPIALPIITAFTRADPTSRPSAHDAYYMLDRSIKQVEAKQRQQRKATLTALGAGAVVLALFAAFKGAARAS